MTKVALTALCHSDQFAASRSRLSFPEPVPGAPCQRSGNSKRDFRIFLQALLFPPSSGSQCTEVQAVDQQSMFTVRSTASGSCSGILGGTPVGIHIFTREIVPPSQKLYMGQIRPWLECDCSASLA